MVKITGARSHLDNLQRIQGANMRNEVGKLVYTLADLHATEAALSITRGSVSGKNHVVSKPGESPNSDTHFLDRHIGAIQTGPLQSESVANARYAADLEFGNSQLAERPFMRPATQKTRKKIEKIMREGVRRIRRGQTL